MGYLFLFLSAISGSIKGFFAKKISNKTSGMENAVLSNLIRMLFCMLIGFAFVLFEKKPSNLLISNELVLISALAGVTTGVFIVSWLIAVQRSTLTSTDAFISMGILMPITLSFIFYNEQVSLSQILGLCLLILSVVIMSAYNNQIKQKMTVWSFLLLILVGVSNGLTDFAYKLYQYNANNTPASVFNFYIYVFSALSLLITFIILRRINNDKKKNASGTEKDDAKPLDAQKTLYIAIMALFLFANSYFKTLAASRLSAIQIYPLSQGMSIIFALLMSAIFFKEKIKPLCIIGLGFLFSALMLINVIVF